MRAAFRRPPGVHRSFPRQSFGVKIPCHRLAIGGDFGFVGGPKQTRNAFPDRIQKIGNDRLALIARCKIAFPRRTDTTRHQDPSRIEQKNLDPRPDTHLVDIGRQLSCSCRNGSFNHIGDQLRLCHQPLFALQHKAVAERVHEQHARHQND